MEILSHRGFWKTPEEKNTMVAFRRSFDLGLGTETDIYAHNGQIVIAHDPPTGAPLLFEDVLKAMDGRNLTLALNIKSDGLYLLGLKELLAEYNHTNYFCFDMSTPQLVKYLAQGLNCYTGCSDIQPQAPLLDQSSGVWLDCFNGDWFSASDVAAFTSRGKHVCCVSADLHGRSYQRQWSKLKGSSARLCTDHPLEALDFFKAERNTA